MPKQQRDRMNLFRQRRNIVNPFGAVLGALAGEACVWKPLGAEPESLESIAPEVGQRFRADDFAYFRLAMKKTDRG